MTRQTNFFATPQDATSLHSWLLNEFPELMVIPTDRGVPRELRPLPAEAALTGDILASRRKVFLIPQWARDDVVFIPKDEWWLPPPEGSDRMMVQPWLSPIIEYIPCAWDPENSTVKVGRLYWCFEGDLEADKQRQMDRMFRWVRSHTRPMPTDSRFRIFDEAAKKAQTLEYWVEIKESNPFKEGTACLPASTHSGMGR